MPSAHQILHNLSIIYNTWHKQKALITLPEIAALYHISNK